MAEGPRFVVDASGNVQDVRGESRAHAAGAAPQDGGHEAPQRAPAMPRPPAQARTGSHKAPIRLIFVPVGLLLALLFYALRLYSGSPQAALHPSAAVANLNSGNLHFADGDYEGALISFDLAIAEDPAFAEAYNSRGLVVYLQGDTTAAIADFDKAIELRPDWPAGYNSRGLAYYATGDTTRAIADFSQAIRLDAGFAKAYLNRGLAYLADGAYEAAIADFDQAITLTPEEGVWVAEGVRHLTPGPGREFAEGVLAYEQLTQPAASLPLAYACRGYAYAAQGNVDGATADLTKALELGLTPDDQLWVEALLDGLR